MRKKSCFHCHDKRDSLYDYRMVPIGIQCQKCCYYVSRIVIIKIRIWIPGYKKLQSRSIENVLIDQVGLPNAREEREPKMSMSPDQE